MRRRASEAVRVLQRFSPRIKAFATRGLDALALLLVAFVAWKIFVAPRSFAPANTHPAPHASYARLHGGTFRVADERGRLLILDFYASWCEPCKIELPLVERWAHRHPKTAVVPIDVGEPRAAVLQFARRYRLSNVALDPQQTASAYFGVKGFPTVVVIDPQGSIRATWSGLNPAIALALDNAERTLASR